ncbi:hypothetical protein EDC64_106200 [Aquabacter spiritensis]|uniref:Tail assembly chaperone E/41/14-like protein n=2 Tax=Aquabacter spiritensis TaxID=933073 RepID=A0A4R3M0X8_9HYPH|nr:hypothetical protein EDC64_106200 [Aquabacter spiritensis]
MQIKTEFPFTLPLGYRDADGTLHRTGIMRRATPADEILPLKDHRVQNDPTYLMVIVLSRVVMKLGSIEFVNTHIIENLFAADLQYLLDLYGRINADNSVDGGAPGAAERA